MKVISPAASTQVGLLKGTQLGLLMVLSCNKESSTGNYNPSKDTLHIGKTCPQQQLALHKTMTAHPFILCKTIVQQPFPHYETIKLYTV